jgi:hypothetical protein
MRILARWVWIPLAITVAGFVYLSMVKLANYQAALKEPQVIREAPRPFVPPPAAVKRETQAMPPPPDIDARPVRPAPAFPEVQLPPFIPPPSFTKSKK